MPMLKVAHTRLPSVGFLAVSLQVTRVINPAVGCHYFPPGPQFPPQPLRGLLRILLLNRGRLDVNSLPKTVTRQRRDCDLNPGPSTPESSTLTTRLPSHLALGSLPMLDKGKVFPYSLPSVGPGADPGVHAVSPQVT